MNIFAEPNIYKKILKIEQACHSFLQNPEIDFPLREPERDIQVVATVQMPKRPGLDSTNGQVRLLHDLANIELQAMELGFRTLVEFPQAPESFRRELVEIIIEESSHLQMCLTGIDALGGEWGDWPIHMGLWGAISSCDTLLERVFIVHRYLESSGLDAGETLLKKLSGVRNKNITTIVKKIVEDEVKHVAFGSRWYFELCKTYHVDPEKYFQFAVPLLSQTNPRSEKLSHTLRRQAGYRPEELLWLEEFRGKI